MELYFKKNLLGVDNEIYEINDQTGPIGVLKLYTKKDRTQVEWIIKNIELASKNAIHIPSVNQLLVLNGRPAIVMQYIDGTVLAETSEIEVTEMGELLAKIHQIKHADQADTSYLEINKWIKLAKKFKNIDRIKKILGEFDLSYLSQLPTGFIHGDFSQTNIIKNEDKYFILDWDHSRVDYLLTDIARSQIFFSFDSRDQIDLKALEKFLRGYNTVRTMNIFEMQFFKEHLMLLIIRILLESFYYIEMKRIKIGKDQKKFYLDGMYKKLLNVYDTKIDIKDLCLYNHIVDHEKKG